MRIITVGMDRYEAVRQAMLEPPEWMRTGEKRPSVSVVIPTKGEKVASPYLYSRTSPAKSYHARRVWLSTRVSALIRLLGHYAAKSIALPLETCDAFDSLQADLIRLEQLDMLRDIRRALDDYFKSVVARPVGRSGGMYL